MKPLPAEYRERDEKNLSVAIAARKAELGERLVILGHHYQRDEIVRFADFTGDSLKLSQLAAEQTAAEYIVFCGVHFMAESAEVLSGRGQTVCLPNFAAGCSMADMAPAEAVDAALADVLARASGRVVPITYVNSTAAVKAATARAGGACCTSSNARNVFDWALRPAAQGGAGGEKIFAIPDQHLGRNTAVAMGYGLDDCVVYDPAQPGGGLSDAQLAAARFILWKGHCYVHQRFLPADVQRVRSELPGVRVIVHPECPHETVRLSDASGSTAQIIRAVAAAEAGTKWAIGTEAHLVMRLADQHPQQEVYVLSEAPSVCAQMMQIDLPHLLWCLDAIAAGEPAHRVTVPEAVAADARVALDRMIAIKAAPDVTPSP